MAELAGTANVELVANLSSKNKLVVLSVTPTTTSDVITFDQSTTGVMIKSGQSFSKIITAKAYDSSTGISKAISHNGSTILTTVGWTVGDNKWFIEVVAENQQGGI